MSEILLYKEYDCNNYHEIEEDIVDAIELSEIPTDKHGFLLGTFTVKLEWSE